MAPLLSYSVSTHHAMLARQLNDRVKKGFVVQLIDYSCCDVQNRRFGQFAIAFTFYKVRVGGGDSGDRGVSGGFTNSRVKGPWSREEDALLDKLVRSQQQLERRRTKGKLGKMLKYDDDGDLIICKVTWVF
ncbi:unnamed protein product [Linum tenue]|uniref:Uncharacterized protein n=1 Tax=Linum tenue TaxID=586396 RepID=A0AAV0MA65_9ROSI|nr:unnamed protein product [Linum tenue]